MYLYHYYDKIIGPFRNLSDIPREEANKVLREIAEKRRFDSKKYIALYGS